MSKKIDAGDELNKLREALLAEPKGKEKKSQTQHLLELARAGAVVFRTADGTAYADINANGHRETYAVRGAGFKDWLRMSYYDAKESAPTADALKSAVETICCWAKRGDERTVSLRVGGCADKIYLDLCDAGWRVLEIDARGRRWASLDAGARFRRTHGMLALPAPPPEHICEGWHDADVLHRELEPLRTMLNLKSERDWVLVVAWLLAALRPVGPYPVLCLAGEQGTAKSTATKLLRGLVDPNKAPHRAPPKEDRDIAIALENGAIIAYDNLSSLPVWLSDALCRISTGGGFATRTLYTDTEETIIEGQRPIILNGINSVAERPDLADRAVVVQLAPISGAAKLAEAVLFRDYEALKPRFLGALLECVSLGLCCLDTIKLPELPRMADFALWATACELALWPHGTFMSAYNESRDELAATAVADDLLMSALVKLASRGAWEGTSAELLVKLSIDAPSDEATKRASGWPMTPAALGKALMRKAPVLRKIGVDVAQRRVWVAGKAANVWRVAAT